MNDVVERFHTELVDAGISPDHSLRATSLYERALRLESSAAAWQDFYVCTFEALQTVTDGGVRSKVAVDSLLRIVEDDFGTALFGLEATTRLRHKLELAAFAVSEPS